MSQATLADRPYVNSNLFSGHYLDERFRERDEWDCDDDASEALTGRSGSGKSPDHCAKQRSGKWSSDPMTTDYGNVGGADKTPDTAGAPMITMTTSSTLTQGGSSRKFANRYNRCYEHYALPTSPTTVRLCSRINCGRYQ